MIPSETTPSLSQVDIFLLEYDTTTVTLPVPVEGNTHSLHVTRILRSNRSGELKSFSDANWPITESFKWQFQAISAKLKEEFLEFLELSAGKEVTITDHENRTWVGVITNPNAAATKVLRDSCGWTVEFDFEGELQ
jgi:hypothetical protein